MSHSLDLEGWDEASEFSIAMADLLADVLDAAARKLRQRAMVIEGLRPESPRVEPQVEERCCFTPEKERELDTILGLDPRSQMLTITQVAQILGLHRTTAYIYARDGRIPFRKIGSRIMVPRQWVEDVVREPPAGFAGLPTDAPASAPSTQ